MLPGMWKQESLNERLEPLMSHSPTKQQYLKSYIQNYDNYQSLINQTYKLFLAYYLAHLVVAIAVNCLGIVDGGGFGSLQLFTALPEVLWIACVFCFRRSFLIVDPHLMGEKRINLYQIKLKATQVYFFSLIAVAVMLLFRNIFVFRSYFLLLSDFAFNILALRDILKIYNSENEINFLSQLMAAQEFYFVPVIKQCQMEEPFQMDEVGESGECARARMQRNYNSFKKYYKPTRRKDHVEYNEEQFQSQLYSH